MRAVRLLPLTWIGPVLFYLVIYWWFVPTSMRLAIPLCNPPWWVKVVIALPALASVFISKLSAEALCSCLSVVWVNRFHRVVAPTTFVVSLLLGLFVLRLFSPLIGIDAPSTRYVAMTFGGLMAFAWLQILKGALGIFANVDSYRRKSNSVVGPTAQELLESDSRAPILYLRSFQKEQVKATTLGRFSYLRTGTQGFYLFARRPTDFSSFIRKALVREYKRKLLDSNRSVHDEQMLFAEYFSNFGPYIAIGRPGESFESMDLGAAKLYVPNDYWQDKVIELIETSGAVVLEAASSEGLTWEIRQILDRLDPERLLIILPRNGAEYRDFCVFAEGIFPHPMPIEMPTTRLLMFDADWTPIPLEDGVPIVEDAVAPFMARLTGTEEIARETDEEPRV